VTITDKSANVVHRATTPTTVVLRADNGFFSPARYDLRFEKKGYHVSTTTLSADWDMWYFGNFICGGLPGLLIVDPFSGAMWKLDSQVSEYLLPVGDL